MQEETTLGGGSYVQCLTLQRLARCLQAGGQPAVAESRLRGALTAIEALIQQQPENQDRIRQRGTLLTDLGDALRDQGRYEQAREAYEERLKIAEKQSDIPGQAV